MSSRDISGWRVQISSKDKFHDLITIAAYSSRQEKEIFKRIDMRYESGLLVVGEFVGYLKKLQQRLESECPQQIKDGMQK